MTPQEKQLLMSLTQRMDEIEKTDRFLFKKHIQLLDGRNFMTGLTTGTKIGTAADQLLGFYGTTPVNQPATISDPSGAGDPGVDQPARNAIISLIDQQQELGLIA